MKQIVVVALLATLLAGCSDNPTKEAVIEDRGVKAAPVVAAPKVDAKAAAEAQAAKVEADKAAAAAAAKLQAEKAETRAASQAAIETKPLEGVKVGAEAKPAGGAAAKPVLDPKDPKGPLAQRKVMFDYDSVAIRDEFRPMLEAHAQYLKDSKQVKIALQGHTDERGSPEYNIALGQRRAEAVFKVLSLLGVAETQMEAVSFGEEKPINEGHDEAAWGQSRRAEIAYSNE